MTQNPNQLVKLGESSNILDLSKAGDKYNVLGPLSVLFANEGMRLRAIVVNLSTKPEDGDVYKAIGGGDGVSLSKIGLMKLASAKGVVWSPECGFVDDVSACEACTTRAMQLNQRPLCPHNVAYRASAAWLDPTGTPEIHSATKAWCWDEERTEVERLYTKQVDSGRLKKEYLEKRIEEEFNKRFRDRYSLAETKAKLRVIREIGVKPVYTPAEINKGFLIPRVEPDLSPEEARRRAMSSASQIFSAPALPSNLPPIDFSQAKELKDEPEQQEQAPAAAAPPAQTPPPPDEQGASQEGEGPDEEMVVCGWKGCGEILGQDVIGWCDSPKGKQLYDGQRFCRAHQREYEAQKKAQEGGGQ